METDRYVFCLMPLLCLISVLFLEETAERITQKLLKNSRIGMLLFGLILTLALTLQNRTPLFRNYLQEAAPENGTVAEYVKGQDVLFLCSPILQPCFCLMLAPADDIYAALPYDEDYRSDVKGTDLQRLLKKDRFYLLVDTAYKQGEEQLEMLQYFANETGTSVYYCTSENTHGVRVDLYEFCR